MFSWGLTNADVARLGETERASRLPARSNHHTVHSESHRQVTHDRVAADVRGADCFTGAARGTHWPAEGARPRSGLENIVHTEGEPARAASGSGVPQPILR